MNANSFHQLPACPLVNVAPAGNWSPLLHALAETSDVVLVTRQAAAALAAARAYPKLNFAPDKNWVGTGDGTLSLDFSRWGSVQMTGETGLGHSLDVFNCRGLNNHNIVLSPELDEEWLTMLAALAADVTGKNNLTPADSQAGAPWQAQLATRAGWLRSSAKNGARPLSPALLAPLFDEVREQQLALTASIFTDAVIQRQRCQFHETGLTEGWLHASDCTVGLWVRPAQLTEIWCVGGTCCCCGENHWALEAYDHARQLAFSLQVADARQEANWRDVFSHAAQNL